MPQLWYRALLYAITLIYYRRVRVVRLAPMHLGAQPTLFVGLHRNGAVDGMLYKRIFPRTVFVVARQLLRSWFARMFFTGIPVARSQDSADASTRSDNPESLARAVDHLVSGGHLFVLPEGTSDLGPRHLPFKPGAARILTAAIDRGVTPVVIPVGIFYESAPTFRSDVCIVVGAPIDVALSPTFSGRERVAAIMARITASLEEIAVEVEDIAALRRVETIAALADEEMSETRWRVQRMLATHALPAEVRDRWSRVATDISARRVAVDRAGVPRFSRRGVVWNAMWATVQSLVVGIAWLANILPLVGGWVAGQRLADAPNTIALWRILIGTPLAVLWVLAIAACALVMHALWVAPAYLAITALGLVAYPEWCVRRAMLRNLNASQQLRDDVAAIARWSRDVAA